MRRSVGGNQRVKYRASGAGEDLGLVLAIAAAVLRCREQRDQRRRHAQCLRPKRGQRRIERCPLPVCGNRLRRLAPAPVYRIDKIDPADLLGRSDQLVTVQQPQRHEPAAQVRHRLAGAQRAQTKAGKRRGAHIHQPVQLGNRIGSIIPQAAPGVGGVGCAGVVILHIAIARRCLGSLPLVRICVEPARRRDVPRTDPLGIGVRQVGLAIDQTDARWRIIHDRGPVLRAGGKIMRKAKRVTHLVRA